MTTIAYDGNTISYDSLISMNGNVFEYTDKAIYSIADRVYVCAGIVSDALKFKKYMSQVPRPEQIPELNPSFEVLGFSGSEGAVYADSSLIFEPQKTKVAIGSGWMWAAAAMDHGATAKEAVEYAITRDLYSGGDVRTVVL